MSAWRHVLNAAINLLWTGLLLTPVYFYCARYVTLKWLLVFGLASVSPLCVSRAILQRFQLSPEVNGYRRLGVPLLVKLTQDAPWLGRLGAQGRRVSLDRKVIARVIRETWMRERFHFGMLVFTGCCSGLAFWQMELRWCVTLIIVNTFYNLYPIWLQQYLRLRLIRPLGRGLSSQSKELATLL
jgi:hypothetical protein